MPEIKIMQSVCRHFSNFAKEKKPNRMIPDNGYDVEILSVLFFLKILSMPGTKGRKIRTALRVMVAIIT
jgi:hypothetical protein